MRRLQPSHRAKIESRSHPQVLPPSFAGVKQGGDMPTPNPSSSPPTHPEPDPFGTPPGSVRRPTNASAGRLRIHFKRRSRLSSSPLPPPPSKCFVSRRHRWGWELPSWSMSPEPHSHQKHHPLPRPSTVEFWKASQITLHWYRSSPFDFLRLSLRTSYRPCLLQVRLTMPFFSLQASLTTQVVQGCPVKPVQHLVTFPIPKSFMSPSTPSPNVKLKPF